MESFFDKKFLVYPRFPQRINCTMFRFFNAPAKNIKYFLIVCYIELIVKEKCAGDFLPFLIMK